MVVVLMGPAGAGKSTVGRHLAELFQAQFIEGDDLHPPENVAAMRAGRPLLDADRAPWLRALRRRIEDCLAAGTPAVVACSALRRRYRDALVPEGREDEVRFVNLRVPPAVLADRLRGRRGHFFTAALLESQLAELEPPTPAEGVLAVDGTRPPERLAAEIAAALA